MSIRSNSELKLFLWLEGFFPKQIVYYLLIKGIAASPAQLYDATTSDPRLSISISKFTGKAIEPVDSNDPKPPGKSSPCLRIVDPSLSDKPIWIDESTSILAFLEESYAEGPSMISPTPLSRAHMQDIRAPILQAFVDSNYYIKHAASITASWSGIKPNDRNLPVAERAKADIFKCLALAQKRAQDSLRNGGWLTPGLPNPGIVDVALAAGARYMELSYSFNIFEEEGLDLLRDWYERYKSMPWWNELEEQGLFPTEMRHPASCREV